MNQNMATPGPAARQDGSPVSGEILSRGKFTIDFAKMKRWHGTPPLMWGQSEEDFQEFIALLATCVNRGDALTESLVYRYGIERYRMGQLLFQRAKLGLIHHHLFVEFARRDEERRTHREDKKENGSHRADLIKTTSPLAVDNTLISEGVDNIRRNMHYEPQHKLDEMTAAVEFEAAIDRYGTAESLIDDCDVRAKVLLRQISLHDIQVAERLEVQSRDVLREKIEEILESQEREWQAKSRGIPADETVNHATK